MALKDVAPLINREFVTVMLDFDRGIGAQDIQKRYTTQSQGLPWFVFLDGTGQKLISSSAKGEGGNVGFPWEPNEIAHFKVMLEKVKKHLSDADIAYLVKSLQDFKAREEKK
jgi:hypothetical protein